MPCSCGCVCGVQSGVEKVRQEYEVAQKEEQTKKQRYMYMTARHSRLV